MREKNPRCISSLSNFCRKSRQLEVVDSMFSSNWEETHPKPPLLHSFGYLSEGLWSLLQSPRAGCIIWAYSWEVSSRFHGPLSLPLFAQDKALLVVQGNFWVEGRNPWCWQCHLKKLIKAEAEQFGCFPWALYQPAPLLKNDTSALAPSLGGSTEAGGDKHMTAHPHLKQHGWRVCLFSVFKTLGKAHSRFVKCKNEHPTGRRSVGTDKAEPWGHKRPELPASRINGDSSSKELVAGMASPSRALLELTAFDFDCWHEQSKTSPLRISYDWGTSLLNQCTKSGQDQNSEQIWMFA